jgi:hypothetical protein
MTAQATHTCPDHPHGLDCPDQVVYYSPAFREYGVISHPAGEVAVIGFCPWCGTRLPESLRDRWFADLEVMGIDPWVNEIPERFRSSVWWAVGRSEPCPTSKSGSVNPGERGA